MVEICGTIPTLL